MSGRDEYRGPANNEDALFAYVDGLVSGDAMPPTSDLERIAQTVQAAGQREYATLPRSARTEQWSEIMHALPITSVSRRELRPRRVSRLPVPRWSAVANGVLAAAVILAMATGIWRGTDWFSGGGSDPERPVMEFAALNAQGTEQSLEVPELPTADDCTANPVTLEMVLALTGLGSGDYSANYGKWLGLNETQMNPPATPSSTIPAWYGVPGQQVPQNLADAVVQAQRQNIACAMTGDVFKYWATMEPITVRNQILDTVYPAYRPESLLAEIESLFANGPAGTRFELQEFTDDTFVPLISLQSRIVWSSLRSSDMTNAVQVELVWQRVDGQGPVVIPGSLTEEQVKDPAYSMFLGIAVPNVAIFMTRDGEHYFLSDLTKVSG